MSGTTIYFGEHGLTPGDDSSQEVVHGWNGARLTKAGLVALRPTITALADRGIGEVYSSDLPRAVMTAEEIRQGLGIEKPLVERRGMRPMDVGLLAGEKKADIHEALSDILARRWAPAPGGESYGRFLGRWGTELDRIFREAEGEDHACLYITHSHNLGALPHLLSGGIKLPRLESLVGGGGVLALKWDGSGRSELSTVFDPRVREGEPEA